MSRCDPISTKELIQMSVLPDNPFHEVSVGFARVDGEALLLIDDYLRFPLVEPLPFTSASSVTPQLDQLFATI